MKKICLFVLPEKIKLSTEGGSPLAVLKRICRYTLSQVRRARPRAKRTRWIRLWNLPGILIATAHLIVIPSPGLDRKKLDYWMPVDQYIGGIEHAILQSALLSLLHQGSA